MGQNNAESICVYAAAAAVSFYAVIIGRVVIFNHQKLEDSAHNEPITRM